MTPTLIRPRALIVAGVLLALLLALALVFAFRAPIVAAVIANRLEAMGLPAPRLAVTEAGLSSLTIEDLRLGTADEARVARIAVRYSLFGEGQGPVHSVRIERPTVRIDLTGGPPLGSLQALLEGESGGGTPALPDIELVEGRVDLLTPLGPAEIAVAGHARSTADGAVTASLDYSAQGGPARLAGGFEGRMTEAARLTGRLEIAEGAIAVTPAEEGVAAEIGGLTGALDIAVEAGQLESLGGRLALTDLGLEQARFRDAELSFTADPERVEASGKLRAQDDGVQAAFRAALRDPFGEAAFGLGLSLAASAQAALFDLVAQPFSRGRGTATLSASGHLPPLTGNDDEAGLLERLLGGLIEGRFTLDLAGLAVPERLDGLDLKAAGALQLADGAAALTLDKGASGHIASIAPAWLQGLGLPPTVVESLAQGQRFAVEPADPLPAGAVFRPDETASEITLDGRLTAVGQAAGGAGAGPRLALELRQALVTLAEGLVYLDWPDLRLAAADLPLPGLPPATVSLSGSLYGQPDELESAVLLRASAERVRQGDLLLSGVSLEQPLSVTLIDGALEAWVEGPGTLRLAGLSHASGLRLTRPASLTIEDGTLLLSPPSEAGTGGDRLAHDLRMRLGGMTLSLTGAGGTARSISVKPAKLRLIGEREGKSAYRGRLHLSGGGAALPELETRLDRLSARLDFDAGFDAPALSLTTDLAYRALPPFRLEAKARTKGRQVGFEATLGAASGPLAEQGLQPRITGDYDLRQGRASFALAPLRLSFAPGLLQPGDLAPGLADLKRVTGVATAEASGTWADGRLAGRGALQLRGLGFTREDVTVQGLDLDLALDQLWPPASPPGQRLSIARLEAGLPLQGLEASFRLLPGAPAKAEIAQLGFTAAGSRFRLRQTLLDPAAARHVLPLEVVELDLQRLLQEFDIEGLSGSGRLSGVLPVTVAGETVTISAGNIASLGPGVLSYRREGPPAPALPAGVPAPPASGTQAPVETEDDAIALFQDPMELTLRALENFHFDRLAIGVDKQADGQARLKVNLQGKNPDLLDGYPFTLNINLTGDVSPLLDALSRGLDISRDLLRRSWRLQP